MISKKLKALHDLQTVELRLVKLKQLRASLDDGTSKRMEVEAAARKVEEADKLLHEATVEMQDKELTLKSVEEKKKKFEDKLYGGMVTNPKELESMEKEVEMLQRQKDKLEERIIELLDIVEERKSALEAARAEYSQLEQELKIVLEKRAREEAELTASISQCESEREVALAQVDPVLLKRYEAMRARAGGIVVSKVEDERCSACHTQIMSGIMRELAADDHMLTCENCGRLLLLEGE